MVFGAKQSGEQVMAGIHLVAHAHEPFLAPWETLLDVNKPLAVGLQVHLVIWRECLEGYFRMREEELKLDDVAEHHVGILQHAAEHLDGLCPGVAPQVLAMVDVERYGQSHLISHLEGLKGGLCSIGGECAGNA